MELKIAIAQMKSTSGDLIGNANKILSYLQEADSCKADLLILPEACLVGYPCKDITSRPNFIRQTESMTQRIIAGSKGKKCAVLFGSLTANNNEIDEKLAVAKPYNSAILVQNGVLLACQHKSLLPNDDVFHEKRHFSDCELPPIINFKNIKIGLLICNDMWYAEPARKLVADGVDILIVSNGSPYHESGIYNDDKLTQRLSYAKARVAENKKPLLFVNAEGGQEDLVFDGQSFILDKDGAIVGLLPPFDNKLYVSHWQKSGEDFICESAVNAKLRSRDSLTYQALVVGLRDYAEKSGFGSVVLGLSGGIDSSLVSCLAVDALGKENVLGICMPSEFSSQGSITDSQNLANNLGIKTEIISIESFRQNFLEVLSHYEDGEGLAGENLQARLRGIILMYIANSTGRLLLATGNKSESAMGYATLYGDMAGGFAPISDLYKMRVFALANFRNCHYDEVWQGESGIMIPHEILSKAPSAELRLNQRDDESLPPYEDLDKILEFLIENNGDWDRAMGVNFSRQEADIFWQRLVRSEYKRCQSALGIRVTAKAFGSGWSYPIVSGYDKEAV